MKQQEVHLKQQVFMIYKNEFRITKLINELFVM